MKRLNFKMKNENLISKCAEECRFGTCYIVGAGDFYGELSPNECDLIIAADGGYDTLKKMNITPNLLLGDMDSLSEMPEGIEKIVYPVRKDETDTCGCGKRGCVEQYCSATGIVRMAYKYLASTDAFSSLRILESISCKAIFDAGKDGDEVALAILDQYYALLGEFLADLCWVVNPEAVVLGGGVSKAGQVLLDGTRPYFEKAAFHAVRAARFELASLGNDAGAYGAFKLAMDSFAN